MTLKQRIREILEDLKRSYPEYADRIDRIKVETSGRLTASAGKAFYFSNIIRISSVFFSIPENIKNHLRNVVVHEVAHLLAGYGAGHGIAWKTVDRYLGGTGKQYHSMARVVPRRKKSRYPVICLNCCGSFDIGPTRRNRILRGTLYRHNCGGIIELV